MKKILAFVMVLTLVLSLGVVGAFADDHQLFLRPQLFPRFEQDPQPLFRHQSSDEQNIGAFRQPPLFFDRIRFPDRRLRHAVGDKHRPAAVLIPKILLHVPAQHDDLIGMADGLFFSPKEIL